VQAGLIRDDSRPLKILGDLGESKTLSAKLNITASRVTDSVRKAVTAAGGSVTETGTRRDKTRGVDRNSDDRSPKNLTKKLKRGSKAKTPAAAENKGEAKAEGKTKADKPAKGENTGA
jgi:hypothetical protein